MSQELRPYQTSNIDKIIAAFQNNNTILYIAPPGSGKTRIFTKVAELLNIPTIIFVHREELLGQTKRVLESQGLTHVDVKTIQGVGDRTHKKYGLIIIDEVHHYVGVWKTLVRLFTDSNTKILGATATPRRLDGINVESNFEKVIHGPEINYLQDNDWLAKFTIITPSWIKTPPSPVTVNGKIVGWVREWKLESLGSPVEIYRRYGNNKPTLVFVKSLREINNVVKQFNNSEITAEGISYHSKNRDTILNNFRSQQTKILVSCEILNDGVDLPFVKTLILLRKTKSFTLWQQQLGRSFRPYNDEKATIIDAVGNATEFGLNPHPQLKQFVNFNSMPESI